MVIEDDKSLFAFATGVQDFAHIASLPIARKTTDANLQKRLK
jgi:hypothetical protein